jgi:hypothetical protein
MPINLLSAGGGTTTLTTASSGSNFTVTIPAATGTMAFTSDITGPTTAQVLTATAGATAGAVGSYAFARGVGNTAYSFGTNYAGSGLNPHNLLPENGTNYVAHNYNGTPAALSGTWKCMGDASGSNTINSAYRALMLWLRVS